VKAAQGLRAWVAVALGVFFLVMTYFAALYCWATRFQTTAAMEIPIPWVYAAMPVGFALMFVHLLFIARGYVSAGRYVESDEMDAEAAASL
jgi:TRAP-type C4-dicarboxylate transport system permease small subunit